MNFIIRHQFRDLQNYYVTTFFNKLYKELIQRYEGHHNFDIVNEPEYEDNGYGSVYSCMNFSIINPKTNKYILISFFDNWKYHFMKHLGWQPNKMIKFFYPGGFNYLDYFNFKNKEKNNNDIECPNNIYNIYESFFYSPYNDGYIDLIDNLYNHRDIDNTDNKLYFRGYLWDFRKNMVENINEDSILILDKNTEDNHLDYESYLKDLSKYRCALSLPGGTEVCNRDIECFAIGIPVIRPYLDINYPDPLISNYHYINCYMDCKYWDGNPYYVSYNDFKNNLLNYWHIIRDNTEYLEFISHNARKWYLKNCTIDNNIQYILSNIDL